MQFSSSLMSILEKFKQAGSVSLYGAGDYAETYYRVLGKLGIIPKNVIVTSKPSVLFHDIAVKSADEVALSEDEIVIGAYDGASVEAIREKMNADNEIIVLSDEDFNCLCVAFLIEPELESLSIRFATRNGLLSFGTSERILVIRLDALGDLVMTSAFIRELHHNSPQAEISLIVRPGNAPLFEECPYITELIEYDCPQMTGTLASQVRARDEVDARIDMFLQKRDFQGFDAVFLPRELLKGRSCYEEFLLALAIPAKRRIGHIRIFEPDQQLLISSLEQMFTLIKQSDIVHECQYMLGILDALGCSVNDNKLEVWCKKTDAGKELVRLDDDVRYIVVGIKASTPSRAWSVEKYKQLLQRFNEKYRDSLKFLLLGDAEAGRDNESLAEMYNAIDLTGKTTLDSVADIMSQSALYVGSNTGLMHMAAACGLPCITLYATLPDIKDTDGNSAIRMGAWGVEHKDLFPEKALDDCHEVCRKPFPHCIDTISVDHVFDEISKMLNLR